MFIDALCMALIPPKKQEAGGMPTHHEEEFFAQQGGSSLASAAPERGGRPGGCHTSWESFGFQSSSCFPLALPVFGNEACAVVPPACRPVLHNSASAGPWWCRVSGRSSAAVCETNGTFTAPACRSRTASRA